MAILTIPDKIILPTNGLFLKYVKEDTKAYQSLLENESGIKVIDNKPFYGINLKFNNFTYEGICLCNEDESKQFLRLAREATIIKGVVQDPVIFVQSSNSKYLRPIVYQGDAYNNIIKGDIRGVAINKNKVKESNIDDAKFEVFAKLDISNDNLTGEFEYNVDCFVLKFLKGDSIVLRTVSCDDKGNLYVSTYSKGQGLYSVKGIEHLLSMYSKEESVLLTLTEEDFMFKILNDQVKSYSESDLVAIPSKIPVKKR
jgi:hypothetical protein